jgi:hypothetical protein
LPADHLFGTNFADLAALPIAGGAVRLHSRVAERRYVEIPSLGDGGIRLLTLHFWGEVIAISLLLTAVLHVMLERRRRK